MNVLKNLMFSGVVAALTLGASNSLFAQRNFDPARFRQDRVDRARETLEVKDDAEWKALEPIVGKVVDAQSEVMRSMFAGGRGFRRGGGGENNGTNSNSDQPRRSRFGGEPSAAVTALQKALEDKTVPAADLKAKLAAVRAEIKDKEAKLAAAQEELRGYLSPRQEAAAVLGGLLK